MIGFLVGTLCLIALMRVLRSGQGGGRCGSGGCGGGARGWGRRRFGLDGPASERDLDGDPDARCHGDERGDWGDHPYRGASSSGGPRERWQRHEQDYRGGGGNRHEHRDGAPGPFGMIRGKAMLWEAFRRLDTTPGQEKVIRAVVDELRARRGAIREELEKAREDAARAMRGQQWDENALGEAIARIDGSVEATRKALVDAMAKTHEVLDEKQRNVLADLIERGGFGGFGGGRGRRGWS